VRVGDITGDGIDDLAYVNRFYSWTIEFRSGADESLLGGFVPPDASDNQLASAIDASGTPLLGLTTGQSGFVCELESGSVVSAYSSSANVDLTCSGDVDQDGLLDWIDSLPPDSDDNSFATLPYGDDGRIDPDPIPDLVPGSPSFVQQRGRLDADQLGELLLQLDPSTVVTGNPVELDTRGGPPGRLAGPRLKFRSYAIGSQGRVDASQDEKVTVQ
jgi:hypothetical protein